MNEYTNKDMPECYQGNKGTLLLISDICVDYDNCNSVESLKGLIDEVKNIADNQIIKNNKINS